MLIVVFVARLWATIQSAPLDAIADPSGTLNPLKAPWFLVGFQELAIYFDPWLAELVFPFVLIVGFFALPYIDPNPRGIGIYGFSHRSVSITLFMMGYLLWLALTIVGIFFRGPYWELISPVSGSVWITAEQAGRLVVSVMAARAPVSRAVVRPGVSVSCQTVRPLRGSVNFLRRAG